jgi:shikimate kinase
MQGYAPVPPTVSRIVLMGFMGAGKSTVGIRLARRLRWRFADSDEFVESENHATVADIFRDHGESHFRQLEAEAILKLTERASLVLALGGGAIEAESTRSILSRASGTFIIFLDAPLDVMIARCSHEKVTTVRPLLLDYDSLEQRLARRMPHYRTAHLTISTAGLRPDEIVDRILAELHHCQLAPQVKEDAPA